MSNNLRNLIESLTEIPANEQHIGHLQIAVQKALHELLDEIERLRAGCWD